MTVYVCHTPRIGGAYDLWADTPDEAFAALVAIGAGDAERDPSWRGVDIYPLDVVQLAAAYDMRLTIVGAYGLAIWLAERDERRQPGRNTLQLERLRAAAN